MRLRTWTIQDVGYDANRHDNPFWECTAESWEEAVAMALDTKEQVSFTQPINDIKGCSIHAVYVNDPDRGSTSRYRKIGCVFFKSVRDA